LDIDFTPVKVPPSLTTPTLAAYVTFNRKSLQEHNKNSNVIFVLNSFQPLKSVICERQAVA
jgi:hypothetical protein